MPASPLSQREFDGSATSCSSAELSTLPRDARIASSSSTQSTTFEMDQSQAVSCDHQHDTDDARTLRCLLLRARAALLRLRDRQEVDGDDQTGFSDALFGLNDWLESAEDALGEEDDQSSSDEPTLSLIKTWTPGPTCTSAATSTTSQCDLDCGSSVSSLQSASLLIPTELLQRLDRVATQQQSQKLQPAAKRPAAGLDKAPNRPPNSSLQRCLLVRPPSAAISNRLLLGRRLLKSTPSVTTPSPKEASANVEARQSSASRKIQRPKTAPVQRTLFSTLSSTQDQQQMQFSTSQANKAQKPLTCKSKKPPGITCRVMAKVMHDNVNSASTEECDELLWPPTRRSPF